MALTSRLLKDPPPSWVFEISEAGIAWARTNGSTQSGFQALEPDVLSVSPLHDNVQRPEAFAEAVRSLAPGESKRRRAALLLPDFSGRLTVLDFDSFPSDPKEQLSLVRFRVKKSVPFDVESAMVSYHAQPYGANSKKHEVVVAVAALEIIARYEAPFRAAGFHPGFVTISSLAALNLAPKTSTVVARLSGRVLTLLVTDGPTLRLVRCIELPEVTPAEIATVLYPTFAYLEDEFASRPTSLLLCGFGTLGSELAPMWQSELNVAIEPLRSRFGAPEASNAGLLGFLEAEGMA